MSIIRILAVRNIRMFLRDRTSVFFSLLSMFIIIGLYVLFLGKTNVNSIETMVGGSVPGIRFLVDSWIMAGIIIVNSITVSLGVFGVMIDDESKKRINGFLVAPVKRSSLVAGYMAASIIVGLILCLLALVMAEIYIVSAGGSLLSAISMLKAIGVMSLSVVSSSAMVFFLVSFVRTSAGFATLSTILGTIIGFITGIYVPIGILPEAVQTFIKLVPASHSGSILRQIFMEQPLALVFAGAPAQAVIEYEKIFGVKLYWSGNEISIPVMFAVVAGSGLFFLGLSIVRMSRRKIG